VELRPVENGVETLVFRIDRYDRAGNRLSPVAVEMQARRAGRVTDGDEVEVSGRWSRGTLRADRIRNLTTASDVVGFPRWLKWAVIAIFLVIVAGCIGVVATVVLPNMLQIPGGVPSVDGMEEAAAFQRLGEAGFFPETARESSDAVPAGHVIRTVPAAGAQASRGGSVKVVVSTGPSGLGPASAVPESQPDSPTGSHAAVDDRIAVPSVAGLDAASATAAVMAAGFAAVSVVESSDAVPQGQAIRSEPSAGTLLLPGDQVLIVTSSGPVAAAVTPPPQVTVPFVAGTDEAIATQTLTEAGLVVIAADEGFCYYKEHTAIRTEPAEGSVVSVGSTITLFRTC